MYLHPKAYILCNKKQGLKNAMASNFSFMSVSVAVLVQTEWRTVMLAPEALESESKLERHTQHPGLHSIEFPPRRPH